MYVTGRMLLLKESKGPKKVFFAIHGHEMLQFAQVLTLKRALGS